MKIQTLEVSPLDANCYLVFDEAAGIGIIIDPGDEAERIAAEALQLGQRWTAILITHGHADHVGATPGLKRILLEKTGLAPSICFHSADLDCIREYNQLVAPQMGIEYEPFDADIMLEDGMKLDWETLSVTVMAVPGHSPGSVVLESAGSLFTGDLLFLASVGRVDLPGGSWEKMAASLRRVVKAFPPDSTVYPGHGPSTTLKNELDHNGYVKLALSGEAI